MELVIEPCDGMPCSLKEFTVIDKHVHDYTMQNKPYNLTISDAIKLMEIILIK